MQFCIGSDFGVTGEDVRVGNCKYLLNQQTLNKFLLLYMLSPEFDRYANSTENAKGMAYPAINDDKFYRALIPIPPIEEQRRIVERLEALLPLCEELKE